jgi:hypothetical protein
MTMQLHAGVAAYMATRLCEEPETASTAATLLADPRWPWRPWSVRFGLRSGWGKYSRGRVLSKKTGQQLLRDGILDPEFRHLYLTRREGDEMRAEVSLETGQRLVNWDWKEPADFTAQIEVSDPKTTFPPWLELIHELMVALRVAHGVLPIWPTYNAVSSDTTFVRIVLDTRWGEYNLGAPGEFDRQRSQAGYWRDKLGTEYIRHPR